MTRYEQGFMDKCAEYGVDGRDVAKALEKRAGLQRALSRLYVKLHPQIDPKKLNWFTKLFTTSKDVPTIVRWSRYIAPGATPPIPYLDLSGRGGRVAEAIRGMRNSTRLSPERILAALGIAGLTGKALTGDSAGSATSDAIPAMTSGGDGGLDGKKLAILGALGLTGAGATAAIAGHKRKKDKRGKNKDEE